VGPCEGRADREGDDNVIGVLCGTIALLAHGCWRRVVFAYSADSPVVAGVMCETMDLRRSVIVACEERKRQGEAGIDNKARQGQMRGDEECLWRRRRTS
jgi:hypothetical protein